MILLVWANGKVSAHKYAAQGEDFLHKQLKLNLHTTTYALQPARQRLRYLGIELWPNGHRLDKRMRSRVTGRLSAQNAASYQALLQHHANSKAQKGLRWQLTLEDEYL